MANINFGSIHTDCNSTKKNRAEVKINDKWHKYDYAHNEKLELNSDYIWIGTSRTRRIDGKCQSLDDKECHFWIDSTLD